VASVPFRKFTPHQRVLVSGDTGFIGGNLRRALEAAGYDVIGLSSKHGDVSNSKTWSNVACRGVERVFHLAGRTYVPDSWQSPSEFYRINAMGTLAALEFCKQSETPLTYVSAYVFGNPDKLPIDEACPLRPNNPYAHSKYMGEEFCRFYAEVFHLDVTIIRPFNVYGAAQNQKFLIPSIVFQALYRDEIRVLDLKPKRDYIYIDDLVDALMRTLKSSGGLHIYNVGSGASHSVAEVIDVVQRCCGTRKSIISEERERNNEIVDVVCDASRIMRDLGWLPRISLEDGISRVIASIMMNNAGRL